MTARGEVLDKWHRMCVECGEKLHINQLDDGCPNGCGATLTRDRSKV